MKGFLEVLELLEIQCETSPYTYTHFSEERSCACPQIDRRVRIQGAQTRRKGTPRNALCVAPAPRCEGQVQPTDICEARAFCTQGQAHISSRLEFKGLPRQGSRADPWGRVDNSP